MVILLWKMEQQLFLPFPLLPPALSSFVALPGRLTLMLLSEGQSSLSSFLESQATQPLQSQKNASPGQRAAVNLKQGFFSQQIA